MQSLTDVAGVLVGHWTNHAAQTGCTVVLLPEGATASGEIRGGAPGTREFALLDPTRMVQHVDAIVLSGGSAFGLAAADGVMEWCAEHGRGFATKHARVPIVVGCVIYDLGVGSPDIRPTAADGYAACVAASPESVGQGRIGAGTGATSNKLDGPAAVLPGGLGCATVRSGDVIVSALMVVNPMGRVMKSDEPWADPADLAEMVPRFRRLSETHIEQTTPHPSQENTTIGVIATNATLDKRACYLVAQSGHDGIARAVWPAHLTGDGDAIVAVSVPLTTQGAPPTTHGAPPTTPGLSPTTPGLSPTTPGLSVTAPLDAVRALASEAVARAIRAAVA
jgi:L-aminopeptidase/D-esterase-like protein